MSNLDIKNKCKRIFIFLIMLDVFFVLINIQIENIQKIQIKKEQEKEVQSIVGYANALLGGVVKTDKDDIFYIYDQTSEIADYEKKKKSNEENESIEKYEIPKYIDSKAKILKVAHDGEKGYIFFLPDGFYSGGNSYDLWFIKRNGFVWEVVDRRILP